jgi:hypothetical protein
MTLRLLHAVNGNLSPMMKLEALKEIRAPPHRRAYQDQVTGHRDFSEAATEMDEMWRNLFATNQIKPAARRQPGGGRVADVSVAQHDDYDDAYAATAAGGTIFSYDEMASQSSCWNCRGFGHQRDACPSSPGKRSIGNAISALQASPAYSGSKGRGKGNKGAGAGKGKGRAHAGRGKGAVAAYVEDNQAYDMDGAFISSLAAAEPNYYDHDEEAHTALATRADAAESDSDTSDGWLGLHCDDSASVVFCGIKSKIDVTAVPENRDSE